MGNKKLKDLAPQTTVVRMSITVAFCAITMKAMIASLHQVDRMAFKHYASQSREEFMSQMLSEKWKEFWDSLSKEMSKYHLEQEVVELYKSHTRNWMGKLYEFLYILAKDEEKAAYDALWKYAEDPEVYPTLRLSKEELLTLPASVLKSHLGGLRANTKETLKQSKVFQEAASYGKCTEEELVDLMHADLKKFLKSFSKKKT